MKVALIHDHLAQDGGAERVLRALLEIYPEAPIYTLLYEEKNVLKNYNGRVIKTSIIQRLPGGIKHYKWYLPFMPMAVEFYDLSDFDVVISDASAFAKGVVTNPNTLHVCYCHTPTRYLWSDTHSYINELNYNKFFKKIISMVLSKIRMWDRLAADRVDHFISNSITVSRRIKKYYRRNSKTIYPPVDVDRYYVSDNIDNYFLIGGRLAPYKRVDLVIEAFKILNKEKEGFKDKYKLKIFGNGIDMPRLKDLSEGEGNIEFTGDINDEEKINLFCHCQAFINPQVEDFGITTVEALAAGRPVIAFNKGGATELITEGKSGLFFDDQSARSLADTISKFNVDNFNSKDIRESSLKFSKDRFQKEIKDFVDEKYESFSGR